LVISQSNKKLGVLVGSKAKDIEHTSDID